LTSDIQRYLRNEPIVARPPTAIYQLRKFVRRHSALAAGLVAVFVVLIPGTITSTREAARAQHAEQTALAERDRAAERLTGRFDNQALVEASIRKTIGETYRDLGLYSEAQRHVERAVDLRRVVLGQENRETLVSMNNLGTLHQDQGAGRATHR
jgi:hypothetical protein